MVNFSKKRKGKAMVFSAHDFFVFLLTILLYFFLNYYWYYVLIQEFLFFYINKKGRQLSQKNMAQLDAMLVRMVDLLRISPGMFIYIYIYI